MRKLYPTESAINTIDAPFPGGNGFISVRYDGPMTPERLEHMKRFWSEVVLPWAEFAIIEEPEAAGGKMAEDCLSDQKFTCSGCRKEFTVEEGTFPAGANGRYQVEVNSCDEDYSRDHGAEGFMCYDCCHDGPFMDDEEFICDCSCSCAVSVQFKGDRCGMCSEGCFG